MRKLVYIGFAFEHHKGTHAGYHQIRDYVNYDYHVDCEFFANNIYRGAETPFERISMRLCNKLFGVNIFPWHILKCILLGLIHNNLTFHFIYGENSYMDFSRFVRKGNKTVCTFHQPFQWFQSPLWLERLKTIDRVILVGNAEVNDFECVVGKGKVSFIPHGIRTDFYHPDTSIKKEHMLLTVGNWLRDYDFANKVYQQLLKIDEQLKIVVVAMPSMTQALQTHPRLKCLTGISDEQLRDLYQRCKVLFLPLKKYTANNALLEAAACGCNIVIASQSMDNSYLPSKYIVFSDLNANNAVCSICNNYSNSTKDEIEDFIRKSYSWEIVGRSVEHFLQNII